MKQAERTWTDLSRDPEALRAYLDKLDQDFATPQRRIEIPARPFQAWLAIQRDFNILMPFGSEWMKLVDDYFATKYGRRINLDMTLGRFLIRLGHEAGL
jgi:hypothetical protein